jgi:hypothetical protein
MAGNDGAASIHCVAMRVAQLDASGAPTAGLKQYVSDSLTRIDFNADIEAGPEISDRNAAGVLVVTWKIMDVIKRLVMTVELVTPDPELEVILSGGVVYTGTGSPAPVIGMQYPPVNVEAVPNGVGIEAWTRAVVNGHQPVDLPWMRWIFPKVRLRKSNRTADVNRMATVLEGFGDENAQFGAGPAGDITHDVSRVTQWYRDTAFPTPVLGAQTIT